MARTKSGTAGREEEWRKDRQPPSSRQVLNILRSSHGQITPQNTTKQPIPAPDAQSGPNPVFLLPRSPSAAQADKPPPFSAHCYWPLLSPPSGTLGLITSLPSCATHPERPPRPARPRDAVLARPRAVRSSARPTSATVLLPVLGSIHQSLVSHRDLILFSCRDNFMPPCSDTAALAHHQHSRILRLSTRSKHAYRTAAGRRVQQTWQMARLPSVVRVHISFSLVNRVQLNPRLSLSFSCAPARPPRPSSRPPAPPLVLRPRANGHQTLLGIPRPPALSFISH